MRFPQPRHFFAAAIVLASSACHSSAGFVAPSDPESAVRGLLNAVKANSIAGMAELWGSEKGPASHWMNRDTMEQRLTVIRIYLQHDKYDILPPNGTTVDAPGRHRIDVRLYRHNGCTPVVPFTTMRVGSGWLVWDIDLTAAGNPAVPCSAAQPGH